MSRKVLLLFGLLAFVIGLVAYLPARVAIRWLPTDSIDVQLIGVRGTLFDGHAERVVGANFSVNNLHWRLNPGAILLGRLSVSLYAPSDLAAISATAAYAIWGTTAITAINGRASLAWLAQHAGYDYLPLAGDVSLHDVHVTLGTQQLPTAVGGRLQLANARWQLAQPALTFGDYSARLDTADDKLTLAMTDSSGPLAIKGNTTYVPANGQYMLAARLRARSGADKRLSDLLATISDPDSDGWYRLRQQGQF